MRQNRADRVRTVICTSCGLAYANPRLDEDEIEALYTISYRDAEEVPTQHLREKEEQSRERLEWLLKYFRQDVARVLEIGCSEGVLLRQLRDELQWRVAGVEPFEPYAQYGIRHWGLEIEISFFQSERYSKPFDLVTFIHVIEHIPDPVNFLEKVARVLHKDGYIFFETPNLWSPKVGRISAALFASPHLAIFSPKSIPLLLERAGFELVELEANRNLRVLARRKGKILQPTIAREARSGPLHATRVAAQYRYWRIKEQALFAKWGAQAFLVRNGKRLLSPESYKHIRKLYRSI
jgi:2-polyprenyl-3-methyl-5-hydroxy-6-metoxy-1,4-benzoquinol methylase